MFFGALKIVYWFFLLLTKTSLDPQLIKMNLCLYIPPLSTNPWSCLKGLITGEVIQYWRWKTANQQFLNREHLITELEPIPHSTVSIIDNKTNTRPDPTKTKPNSHNTLYFHWKYDSTDTIQKFDQTLKNQDNFEKFQTAISWLKTFRGILWKTILKYDVQCNLTLSYTIFIDEYLCSEMKIVHPHRLLNQPSLLDTNYRVACIHTGNLLSEMKMQIAHFHRLIIWTFKTLLWDTTYRVIHINLYSRKVVNIHIQTQWQVNLYQDTYKNSGSYQHKTVKGWPTMR